MNDLLYVMVMVASLALAIGRVQLLSRMIARQAAPEGTGSGGAEDHPSRGPSPSPPRRPA